MIELHWDCKCGAKSHRARPATGDTIKEAEREVMRRVRKHIRHFCPLVDVGTADVKIWQA